MPETYWRPHGDEQRRRIARPAVAAKVKVECLCGNRPVIPYGELRGCRTLAASPHRCDRVFIWTGGKVLAARA